VSEVFDLSDYRTRRVTLGNRDTNDPPAPCFDDVTPDDPVGWPICTFDQHVWLQKGNDLMRSVFVEDHHGIDWNKRRYHFGPFRLRNDRASFALDAPDRSIGIDGHDERVTVLAGVLEVSHVARVQNVEDTVGKDDLLTLLTQSCHPDTSLVVGQHRHSSSSVKKKKGSGVFFVRESAKKTPDPFFFISRRT
jgi:hypothetical protein